MRISKRLERVAAFVPEGSRLADIGTDHGYVPIFLILEGKINYALAMDIRKGPLTRAGEHIREYGLQDKIETRLSDGLQKLGPGEADAVVIAGMGGELIIKILEEGRHLWDLVKVWILSPQSDLKKVRKYLARQNFLIEEETMLTEDGKYYTVMRVVRGPMKYEREIDYLYGNYLIIHKDPVLMTFLEKEIYQAEVILKHLKQQDTESAKYRINGLTRELMLMKEAKHEMQ